MAITTGISWTDATWNPFQGCIEVSPGCKNCYAKRDALHYGKDFHNVVKSKTTFNDPVKWFKSGKLKPFSYVFTCSISDFFIADADVWRDEAWRIIKHTPYIYLILTKRTQNIRDRLPKDWENGYPNVYLGATVETQDYIDRASELYQIPCEKRFISYEPALGMLNAQYLCQEHLTDWIIAGGESGPNHRAPDPKWFRSVRDYCKIYNIPFFFKQWGGNSKSKIDGTWGGCGLDGGAIHQYPVISPATTSYIESIVRVGGVELWRH
jgi:protein gp37